MALYSFDSSMKLISNLINLFEVYCWPSVMMMIKDCLLVYYYLLLRCSVDLCRMNELRMDTASILLGCAWLDHWIAVSITKDLAIYKNYQLLSSLPFCIEAFLRRQPVSNHNTVSMGDRLFQMGHWFDPMNFEVHRSDSRSHIHNRISFYLYKMERAVAYSTESLMIIKTVYTWRDT